MFSLFLFVFATYIFNITIDKETQEFSTTIGQIHTVKKYKKCKVSQSDKAVCEKYKTQITLSENALSKLKNLISSSQIQRIF